MLWFSKLIVGDEILEVLIMKRLAFLGFFLFVVQFPSDIRDIILVPTQQVFLAFSVAFYLFKKVILLVSKV